MSTNYHTPIAEGAPIAPATFNTPLGQLDSQLSQVVNAGTDIAASLTKAYLVDGGTLVIAAGALAAPTHTRHSVDTEAAASADDLDTIGAGADGQLLTLVITAPTRTVTLKHGVGNIILRGSDVTLGPSRYIITLMYHAGFEKWIEVG